MSVVSPKLQRSFSGTRASIDSKLQTSKWMQLGTGVTEPQSIEAVIYDIHNAPQNIPCGRNLSVNQKWLVTNWKTGGGSKTFVRLQTNLGRVGEAGCTSLSNHNKEVSSHALSMLQEDLLATGSWDGKVNVFELPKNGQLDEKSFASPAHSYDVCDKVTCIQWCPTVPDVLAVGSSGGGRHILAFMDTKRKMEKIAISEHTDQIMDIAFDPFSHLVATTCKDGGLRVFNPSTGDMLAAMECKQCVRDCRVHWVDREHLVVAGTGKGSVRGVSLWNWKTGAELNGFRVDVNSCSLISHYDYDYKILFVASTGSRIMKVVEVNVENPMNPLNELAKYTSASGDFCGLGFLHKESSNVAECVYGTAWKLLHTKLVPMTFTMLRKRTEYFQDDLFAPIVPNKPVMSTDEYLDPSTHPEGMDPPLFDPCPAGMDRLSEAPEEEATEKELQYLKTLEERNKPKPVNNEGKTDEEERARFRAMADSMPARSKFDSQIVDTGKDDVDDDEWGEDSD